MELRRRIIIMITSDVISQLDLLNIDNKLERYLIGPDQKYIGSLLNSGTNNLEENLKIGQNEIITRWYESNCYRETIEFRSEDITENYYYIEYYEYNTLPIDILDGKVIEKTPAQQNTKKLFLNAHNKYSNYGTSTGDPELIQKYKLYFKNNSSSELISVKTVTTYRTHANQDGEYVEVISHTDN